MKVKVKEDYYDRETWEKKTKGEIHEYEDARAKELIKKGFAEEVKEQTKKPEAAPAKEK